MSMNYSNEGLKNTAHLKTVRLMGSMRKYGHEQLNLRTSWVTCNSFIIIVINSNGLTQDLQLEDATTLKGTKLIKFIRKLWSWTNWIKGQNNNKEIMYMTLLILILTYSKHNSKLWWISKNLQLNSKSFLNSSLNFLLNVNYEFNSYGSWYEGSRDDKVESLIHSHNSHYHLFMSWNKILEIVVDSSKGLKRLSQYNRKNSQDLIL